MYLQAFASGRIVAVQILSGMMCGFRPEGRTPFFSTAKKE
jgi:hypothetical protein